MIKYKITANGAEVIISLDANDPNEFADIQYEGDSALLEIIQMWLPNAFGAFGHSINDNTSPIDLDCAIKKGPPASPRYNLLRFMPYYKWELLVGADLVKIYDPGIPPGAFT